MPTRILIADGQRIVRQGLRALLDGRSEIELVGEAEDGRSAVELASRLSPDVVVMEVLLPELNGVEATRKITSSEAGPRVLALSASSDTRCVARMFEAGADGFVAKNCTVEELLEAIRTVAANKPYLSPDLAGAVVHDFVRGTEKGAGAVASDLTPRQREVLQLIAEGESTREIADTLHVSVKTVETHRRSIMERLNLQSIAELTKYAVREGFTSLER